MIQLETVPQREERNWPAIMMGIAKVGANHIAKPTGHNGVYGFVFSDGSFDNDTGACHAGVLNKTFRKRGVPLEAVVTKINRKGNDSYVDAKEEAALAWYDYLFNRSVYAPYVLTKDVNEAWSQGYCAIDAECPGNLLQSFCIATRNVWEFKEKPEMFHRLVSLGVNEEVALLVGYFAHIDAHDSSTGYCVSPAGNHQIMSTLVNIEGAKAWLNKKPLVLTDAYNKNVSERVSGVNAMFEGQGKSFKDCLTTFIKSLSKKETRGLNPFIAAKHVRQSDSKVSFSIDELAKALIDKPESLLKAV